MLEVVALGAGDAVAAQAGGADRLELAGGIASGRLTPSLTLFTRVRQAVDIPVRVLLRDRAGFTVGDLHSLCGTAAAFLAAGADAFAFGFLDHEGNPDLVALEMLVAVIEPCRWTFHRAIDRANNRDTLRKHLAELPGLDTYLTAGAADGVDAGLPTLLAEAALRAGGHPGYEPRIMAGDGLRLGHVPRLREAGIDAFHLGRAARPGGWSSPVSESSVRSWRRAL
jgi:copper homeostasis protein